MKIKSLFYDEWNNLRDWAERTKWFLIIVIVPLGVCLTTVACLNYAYIEGVETTVTGTVQLHILGYHKIIDKHYTNMELRTYSGDTHHVSLLDHHPEFELHKAYTITYVTVNYWNHIIIANELVSTVEKGGG